jgi:hypothetical protein
MVSKMSRNRRRQQVGVIPQFDVTKNPEYKSVSSTGIFGGVSPNDAKIIFFLDRLEPEMVRDQPGKMRTERINRELQVEIHMSPHAYKTMSLWMQRNVTQYEERFGEIRMGPPGQEDDPALSHIS